MYKYAFFYIFLFSSIDFTSLPPPQILDADVASKFVFVCFMAVLYNWYINQGQ